MGAVMKEAIAGCHVARLWICLAYFASGFNTGAVDHEADGSTNNGIFQINSRKWCKTLDSSGPNMCQMHCFDLLDPDLKDSVICAMKITQDPRGLGSCGFNTGAVDHEADGSTNNGIFQINSRKWCKTLDSSGPNMCQMHCFDLLDPDLKDSVICAMKITQDPRGLGSWETWRHHCQGIDLSDWVDGCDL
ncbi:Sperm acrosome membrane-associated protein 3 [Camelus dromedarius]|uniref:Sperm acrosome membrane-associated protein 3 n=1 Tax=Camelus dromedarius TaxID=9838 RepID=A0A5N4D204_CAMDR|nr:Sperm acrosome membrane-associated protein 3 [Camelus dromedarius]